MLFATSYYFILFEAKHCYVWTMLETYNMSCFTCWSFLLFANSQWFLYYFLMIDTCFAKGGEVANQIFAYKKDELFPSIVFLSHIVLFGFVLSGYSI